MLLIAAALPAYEASLPESPGMFVSAFMLSALCFSALGVFLAAMLPTNRAAQGLGLILFFVMMILSGAGPPREVMTEAMHWIADITLLRYVILTLQDPWLGFGWNVHASLLARSSWWQRYCSPPVSSAGNGGRYSHTSLPPLKLAVRILPGSLVSSTFGTGFPARVPKPSGT